MSLPMHLILPWSLVDNNYISLLFKLRDEINKELDAQQVGRKPRPEFALTLLRTLAAHNTIVYPVGQDQDNKDAGWSSTGQAPPSAKE